MSEHHISLTVDGETESLTVAGRTLLVHALRDHLGITAPKVGCETSKCGACTVSLEGDLVKSCTVLAVQADGCSIQTAADTDDPLLERVRDGLHDAHGLQCGYCTPGMVMSTADLLQEADTLDEDVIRDALKGNICRCTGYTNIVSAIEQTAVALEGSESTATPTGQDDGGDD